MIDHCIKLYTIAQRQEIYKIYVSDALRIITENTAKFVGGGYIKKRYIEIVEPKNNKQDNRSAQEIIDDVVSKSGIKVVRSNGCVGPESDNNA